MPFFGNILSVLRAPPGEEVFKSWRKIYGKVFTYWMGNIPVVFIADYDTCVETYQKDGDTHSGRPAFIDFELMIRGVPTGLMLIDGKNFALKINILYQI